MTIRTTSFVFGALALLTAVVVALAQPQRGPSTKEFMRDKLELSQKVLEALTTEDFDGIVSRAKRLSAMTQEASWQAFQNPDYERYSLDFRRNVDALAKAAEKRNIDGATLAYVKVTLSCVECHKFVRGKLVASAR
jgi:hypothetical protein